MARVQVERSYLRHATETGRCAPALWATWLGKAYYLRVHTAHSWHCSLTLLSLHAFGYSCWRTKAVSAAFFLRLSAGLTPCSFAGCPLNPSMSSLRLTDQTYQPQLFTSSKVQYVLSHNSKVTVGDIILLKKSVKYLCILIIIIA